MLSQLYMLLSSVDCTMSMTDSSLDCQYMTIKLKVPCSGYNVQASSCCKIFTALTTCLILYVVSIRTVRTGILYVKCICIQYSIRYTSTA